MKSIRCGELGPSQEKTIEALNKEAMDLGIQVDWSSTEEPSEVEIKTFLAANFLTLVSGPLCQKISKSVTHRSVGSHFLNYIDLLYRENDQVWGYSFFVQAFINVFRDKIKNQDYKGSVIFLGTNPFVAPVLSALATFGFEDFVFLELDEPSNVVPLDRPQSHSGLINVNLSSVNSQAFVQSQKEYSLCFVMENSYPEQTLEDMSYFHFLSSQSMVFDLSGKSNFLFDEVKALGVETVMFEDIDQARLKLICEKFREAAAKIG